MFSADSDILGILLALLTFMVPVISSIMEKKRKNRRSSTMQQEYHEEQIQEEFVQEEESEPSRAQEIEELFNELLGLREQPQEQETGEEEQHVEQVPEVPEEPLFVEKVEPVTMSIEPAQQTIFQEDENACGEKRESLKERFRNNPKDAVIFAEILKPKFKEN